MTGEERRSEIVKRIKQSKEPISGSVLAKEFSVSRQVIVQDIALLRASLQGIVSTPKGYIYQEVPIHYEYHSKTEEVVSRIYYVKHDNDQMEQELNAIVDLGGKVIDVFVNHDVYGSIRVELPISCRRHVKEFISSIQDGSSVPLNTLTSGVHYHTVEADSEETLDLIEKELTHLGILI